MGYQPKLVRGRVKGTDYPIDGRELIFSLWDYDNYESFHLDSWDNDDDEAVMQTLYWSENEELRFCLYDTLEDFVKAWKTCDYEPECTFCLVTDKIDVLEIIREEGVT